MQMLRCVKKEMSAVSDSKTVIGNSFHQNLCLSSVTINGHVITQGNFIEILEPLNIRLKEVIP